MDGLNLDKMDMKTKFNPLTSITIANPKFEEEKNPVPVNILEKYSNDNSTVNFVDGNCQPIEGKAHDYYQSSYATQINAFFGYIDGDSEDSVDMEEQPEPEKCACHIIAVDDVDEFEEISPGHKE